MGRVIGVLALGAAVVACEPRPTELYIPREGNDWILIDSENSRRLIRRDGDVYQLSSPFQETTLEDDAIALPERDAPARVVVFEEGSLMRLHAFELADSDLVLSLEVVSFAQRADSLCRCHWPQSRRRALIADDAICPTPEPTSIHEFDPSSGTFSLRPTPLLEAERPWLRGPPGGGTCRTFVGTEVLLGIPERLPRGWRPAELPRAPDPASVCLAAGERDFLVVTEEGEWHRWPGSGDGWAHTSIAPSGACLGLTSLRGRAGQLGFAGLEVRSSTNSGSNAVVRQIPPGPLALDPTRHTESELAGFSPSEDPLFWRDASSRAVATRDDQGRFQLLSLGGSPSLPLEPRRLPEEPAAIGGRPLPSQAVSEVLAAGTGASSWLSWVEDEELRLAWLVPASGAQTAQVRAVPGVPPGALRHMVVLAEDRVVLVFRVGESHELWEWVQLPASGVHPYDQRCERTAGTFCFRPFPTSPGLDGRVPCDTPAEVAHVWAEPVGVGLVHRDGHTWRSGSACAPQRGLEVTRGVSTDDGRSLVLDRAGAFWLSAEES